MYDIVSIIVFGLPSAMTVVTTIVGGVDLARRAGAKWSDHREREELKKYPISPGEQRFYVKSTYAKYIMADDSSELTKVREIRALKDVQLITIDRAPTNIEPADVAATGLSQVNQDCFSIPGVALRRDEYYQIVLGYDQIFKAKANHMYLISCKLRQRLDKLHPNPDEDGIQIEKPFGTEKFSIFLPRVNLRRLTIKYS